ncbi:MAG: DUF4175 domain-containing protein [Flavobacteriales bacterium]|nr:DUF4175 domain-containing protein [Flavobacteriales bacterium]HQW39594.1 hypothetical protein [Flavobacteriales bacterium]
MQQERGTPVVVEPFMHTDKDHLISKLDAFIRKFYKDRLIRGVLYSVGLLVAFFLIAALMEYVGHFGTGARTALFWGTVVAGLFVVGRFIALPLVKLFNLGEVISHKEAARIVGTHFSEVKDKLLNTLQLREMASAQPDQRELIEAAIAQRSRELSPVPFANAIDLSKNRKYLRYALPPLLLLVVLLFAAPSLITGPTKRLIAHSSEFIPDAPFRFVLLNDSLEVPEEQDFEVTVEIQGQAIPQQVDLEIDGQKIPLVKKDAVRFTHRFRNVQEAVAFRFSAEGFNSKTYTLNTIPDPLLLDFSLSLDFPGYLGRPNETANNTGDLTVPAGTRITWNVNARSSDALDMVFDDSTYTLTPVATDAGRGGVGKADVFRSSRRFMQSRTYKMSPRNGARSARDPLQYRVEVVPDLYPTINVETKTDSTALKRMFYRGEVGDDHGFKRLLFHYRFVSGGDSVPENLRTGVKELPIDARNTRQEFFHSWDMYAFTINPGDKIEHWFEVWDNDGVHGSKSARSTPQVFAAPTLKELAKQEDAQAEAIKGGLKENIKEAQDLQKELDKLRREILEKKDVNWQDKQKLENVMQRQQQLQKEIEKSSEQLRQSQQQQQEFRPNDERLLEKQQQVQELFENVLSEEMKELYKQVQELMEKLDKDKLQEQLQDMKLGQEDIEKELDRALELFKRMEVEQKADDIAKQLEELAEKQEKLSEETKEGKTDQEELKKEQEALNKEMEELRKEVDELEKKNEALEEPMDIPKTDEQEQGIQDEQKKSGEELEKKQNGKASDAQKKAAEQMEQLAFQMKSAMQSNEEEQSEEDMDALRQLLENIVQLSFDEEALMEDLATTSTKDPRFVDHGRTQRKLRDDAKVIEDSLFALSKRVPQLQSIVNREMNAVNDNMDEATKFMGEARANERYKPMAADKQQHAMTSLNNLALLLDEALQQMMAQMNAQGKPGSGSCKKPGGSGSGKGGKKMAKMKANQETLQKQLEKMREAMEKGKKPGEKPGEQNPGGMGPGMSKQLAQMAAQQAAIRKEMQKLAQELNKDGSGAGNPLNKLAEQMEQNEKDIVNKQITPETMRRQQDIMTRLLEHEKAERERELDQKRTSNEGKVTPAADPARYFDYQRRKAREAELLRTVPPGLKPYYRDRVNSYFGTFDRP